MYTVGSYVAYGLSGVCQVTAVGERPELSSRKPGTRYYTLRPLGEQGVCYVPVEANTLRPLMTRGEALSLLRRAPEGWKPDSSRRVEQQLRDLLKGGPREWLELFGRAEYRRRELAAQKKRLGDREERYRKAVLRLLTTELSMALGSSAEAAEERLEACACPDPDGRRVR